MVGNARNGMRLRRCTDKRLDFQVIHVYLSVFIGKFIEVSLFLSFLLLLLSFLLLLLFLLFQIMHSTSSEKTHNDCDLHQRMPSDSSIAAVRKDTQRLRAGSPDAFEDSIAVVRKDTQRREANALHLKRRELKRPEKTHSNSTVAEPAPAKCRILTLSSEEPQNSCDCKRSTSPAPKTMSICRCI